MNAYDFEYIEQLQTRKNRERTPGKAVKTGDNETMISGTRIITEFEQRRKFNRETHSG